jgi:hypothetical protein
MHFRSKPEMPYHSNFDNNLDVTIKSNALEKSMYTTSVRLGDLTLTSQSLLQCDKLVAVE